MLSFIIRRIITLIPILFLISVVSFFIIELPPGDFATYYIENLRSQGMELSEDEQNRIAQQYGLGGTPFSRYYRWMKNILTEGNFGWSFAWQKPVKELLAERLPLTLMFSILSLIVSWAIPGQGGDGHINEQEVSYIRKKIEDRGFVYDADATKRMRDSARIAHFVHNIMVFHRAVKRQKAPHVEEFSEDCWACM